MKNGSASKAPNTTRGFDYVAGAGAGLFLICIALFNRSMGIWSVLPAALGVATLFFRWVSGPVLVLIGLVWIFLADSLGFSPLGLASTLIGIAAHEFLNAPMGLVARTFSVSHPFEARPVSDFLLAAGVLTYAACSYRWLGIEHHILPIDPRKKDPSGKTITGFWPWSRTAKPLEEKRPGHLVTWIEFGWLAAAIGLAAIASLLLGQALFLARPPAGLAVNTALWRAILLIWLGSILFLGYRFVVGYWSQSHQGCMEGYQTSQDVLWRETRIEQRRVARWFAKFIEKRVRRKQK